LDGGDGAVDISRTAASGYNVYMFIGELNQCTGELRGTGRVTGNRMIFTAPVPEQEPCEITMTRNGARLSLVPSQSCSYFHGSSCALVGTVTRTSSRPQDVDGDGGPNAQSDGQRGQAENPATAYAELVGATENGGMPGCIDPNLKGRERAVAERLGGSPCGSTTAAPTGGASWIVGSWTTDRFNCQTIADLNLRPDGTFFTDGNSGTWSLSNGVLRLLIRRENVPGGELGDERSVHNAPPVVNQVRQLTANRLSLRDSLGRVVTMERCR
jgi:hypothetical protein